MKITLPASAALAIALMASPAFADTGDIRASDRAVEFDVGATDLKYGESINNAAFDTENGWMPTLKVGLTWLTQDDGSWTGNTYLHIDGQASFGTADYNGGVQVFDGHSITDFPYNSTTNEQVYRIDSRVGHLFEVTDGVSLTPYLGIGFRGWDRSVKGGPFNAGPFGTLTVSSSAETYQHFEGSGGLLAQVSPMPQLVLSAFGQFGSTFAANMRSSGQTYNLGSRPAWQVGGSAGYAITPRFELVTSAQFDGFGYNKSAPLLDGAFSSSEPDSYTHELTLLTGVAYHFH